MADKKITLKIIASDAPIDKRVPEKADMVIMRCVTGDLGVLPGHTPISMVLDTGTFRIYNDGVESKVAVGGGVASVSDDVVTVLTESVEWIA